MIAALSVLALAAVASADPLWSQQARSSSDEVLEFSVALKQRNLDVLNVLFDEVTTPGSPRQGQYLSRDGVNRLTASDPAHVRAAMTWLSKEGAACKALHDSLRCRAKVGDLERALQTEFYAFEHATRGDRVHRLVGSQEFPSAMEGVIEFIEGLNKLPVEHLGSVHPVEAPNGADQYVVPETLSKFYSLDNAVGDSSIIQAAVEYQNYPGVAQSDTDTFIKNTGIKSFSIAKFIGPQSTGGVESTLDVQYIGATGAGVTNWYITESGWVFSAAQSLLNTAQVPDVLSNSYGWDEEDQCQIAPSAPPCQDGGSVAFVQRTNTEWQKLGATGVTILFSSGDSGSHGRTDPMCSSPKTRPAYPAASPYVTAVGATQIVDGTSSGATSPICSAGGQQANQCATGGTEVVANTGTGALIVSGGGFSEVAAMPSWQKDVVQAYIQNSNNVPPAGDFNASGRGYPDIAALGHKVYIELNGAPVAVDGTSCSSPIFAGVFSVLNSKRVAAGKPKIGFANPLIYQIAAANPNAFNDITQGTNCGTEQKQDPSCSQCTGFHATKGWDATTGFGTPNYPELVKGMTAVDAKHGI